VARPLDLDELVDHFTLVDDELELLRNKTGATPLGGICPGNNTSGGKSRSGRTRHGSVWLQIALTEAA
jgi:hypothetical protein